MPKAGSEEKPLILERCSGCGYCFLLCPQKAVEANEEGGYRINEEACTACGHCIFACPADAIAASRAISSGQERTGQEQVGPAQAGVEQPGRLPGRENGPEDEGGGMAGGSGYDAVIIGSGIGGLLTAAGLTRKGKKIVLVERLNFTGGRFTHFNYEGVSISTGACHSLPYGEKGPFAELIRTLGLPVTIRNAGGMGGLNAAGKQYRWREIMECLVPFSRRDRLDLLKILLKILATRKAGRPGLVFGDWLAQQTSSAMIRTFFERMINFGCSVGIDSLPFDEAVKIIKNVYRAKASGVIVGGCGTVVEKLVEQVRTGGGAVLTESEAKRIVTRDGYVSGVEIINRRSGAVERLKAKLVISDIGPKETYSLLESAAQPLSTGESLLKGAGQPLLMTESENDQFGRAAGPAVAAAAGSNPGSKAGLSSDQGEISRIQLSPGLDERPGAAVKIAGETSEGAGAAVEKDCPTSGLCINMVCDVPLLDHGSILYCLDTKRVAGLAQPTNTDPGLAPRGRHLLISYQMLEGDQVGREVKLGLSDLESLFGDDFSKHCRVINTGVFKNGWPVNRSAQGRDVHSVSPVKGLYLVGDGCKAPGYVMVEGIAKQVAGILAEIT